MLERKKKKKKSFEKCYIIPITIRIDFCKHGLNLIKKLNIVCEYTNTFQYVNILYVED